jgi:hypothetical protein
VALSHEENRFAVNCTRNEPTGGSKLAAVGTRARLVKGSAGNPLHDLLTPFPANLMMMWPVSRRAARGRTNATRHGSLPSRAAARPAARSSSLERYITARDATMTRACKWIERTSRRSARSAMMQPQRPSAAATPTRSASTATILILGIHRTPEAEECRSALVAILESSQHRATCNEMPGGRIKQKRKCPDHRRGEPRPACILIFR